MREAYTARINRVLDYDPVTHTQRWRIEMKSESKLTATVDVQQLPPVHVAYLRHVGPYQGDGALFERLWGRLMHWAGPRGLYRGPETTMMTVYHDDPDITDKERLRLSVCIGVPEGTPVEGEIGAMTVPGGAYGVARFELSEEEYGDAWNAVFGGWMPESGYQPDDRPAFEICRNDPREHPEGKHIVDICAPVRPL